MQKEESEMENYQLTHSSVNNCLGQELQTSVKIQRHFQLQCLLIS